MLSNFRGCLFGLAVGDALGRTVEGMSYEEIKNRYGFIDDYLSDEAEWTDDTEQALLLAESIASTIYFTPEDTAVGWQGIRFYLASGVCSLSYCAIEYAKGEGVPVGDNGSGVLCIQCSPTFRSCAIRNCFDYYGGGISILTGDPAIEYCTISNNSSVSTGGGVYCDRSCPNITNTTIESNTTEGLGGGIYCGEFSSPKIVGSTIVGNSADIGGALYCEGGGLMSYDTLIISGSVISRNFANSDGGGLYFRQSRAIVINNIISNNTTNGKGGAVYYDEGGTGANNRNYYINNVISENSGNIGGGFYINQSEVNFINNTLSGNTAINEGGAIYFENTFQSKIFNTVLWNDMGTVGTEIYIVCDLSHMCTLHVAYSNVHPSNCVAEEFASINWGSGIIIGENPLFSDSLLHLLSGSPCVDAGAESIYIGIWDTILYAPTTDLEGNPRPLGEGWDIGAYEYDSGGIIRETKQKPHILSLTAFPNPFNSSCAITAPAGAEIEIYDLRGRLVNKPSVFDFVESTSLVKGGTDATTALVPLNKGDVAQQQWGSSPLIREMSEGQRVYVWTPNESITSGVYLVRARTNNCNCITKKIVLIK